MSTATRNEFDFAPRYCRGYIDRRGYTIPPRMIPQGRRRGWELTASGAREVLLGRIDAARREGRGVR